MARAPFDSILAVCTGNICRSPIVEALLRTRLAAAGVTPRIESAGIGAVVGAGAHEHAREVMSAWDISLDDHVARQFEGGHDAQFELIFVMETGQKEWIEHRYPQLSGRTWRLGHWLDEDIADPMGHPVEAFHASRDHIDRAIDSWFERLGVELRR